MADKKGSSSRLRSLRDSVKHITKRLSVGGAHVMHRNDEQARETEKLRVQIQSMEDSSVGVSIRISSIRHHRRKLVSSFRAKAQIEALAQR